MIAFNFFSNEERSATTTELVTKFIANGRETTLYMGDEWLGRWVKGMALFLRERDEVDWFAGGDGWWGILYCVEKQRCK